MLRRAGNIITYIALVALLLLNGTAHEFVHSFAAHEDTVDIPHNHSAAKAFFEKEHHHCDFLDLAIIDFDHYTQDFSFNILQEHTSYYIPYGKSITHCKIFDLSDRGPPSGNKAFLSRA